MQKVRETRVMTNPIPKFKEYEMQSNFRQIDPLSQDYPGQLRNAAAGLIKSFIRARACQEPNFLTANDYKRWSVTGLESENRPCARLLTQVKHLLAKFRERFLFDQVSVSEPEFMDDTDDVEILGERVANFIWGDLDEAIRIAASEQGVAWERLADWAELASLRDALDQLPSPLLISPTGVRAVAQSRRVTLYGMSDNPVVNGKQKERLTANRYKLIKRLIKAGDEGCSKSDLEGICQDYWKSLNNLKKDSDWESVIRFPGKPHGRYCID